MLIFIWNKILKTPVLAISGEGREGGEGERGGREGGRGGRRGRKDGGGEERSIRKRLFIFIILSDSAIGLLFKVLTCCINNEITGLDESLKSGELFIALHITSLTTPTQIYCATYHQWNHTQH